MQGDSLSNEEWAIRALNIHGTFFEQRCQDVVRSVRQWKVQEPNYPVEYREHASNLDIWVELAGRLSGMRYTLCIECKKNNPDFVDWVFFPKQVGQFPRSSLRTIQVTNRGMGNAWVAYRKFESLEHGLTIVDDGRETKGDYQQVTRRQDFTKTSNDAITKAAQQVAIATQALIQQEYSILEDRRQLNAAQSEDVPALYGPILFLPIIVTTANLFTCQFKNEDVDLDRGEIDLAKASLKPCQVLVFDYPVPSSLQQRPLEMGMRYTHEALSLLARMPIFVVHSMSLSTFLSQILTLKVPDSLFDYYRIPFDFGEDIE